jgi:hypothetical protein
LRLTPNKTVLALQIALIRQQKVNTLQFQLATPHRYLHVVQLNFGTTKRLALKNGDLKGKWVNYIIMVKAFLVSSRCST